MATSATFRTANIGARLLTFCCLAAFTVGSLWAQTSPRGTFKIDSVKKENGPDADSETWQDFIVSTADPTVRELFRERQDIHPSANFISPDERWIFTTIDFGSHMGGGELFKRGQGFKFEPALSKDFADLAWRFFAEKERIDSAKVPYFINQIGIIDFVSWSLDSRRLLVALRGGEFDGDRNHGIYLWYAYFDTHDQSFELTDYLRGLNKGAWKRYSDDALRAAFGGAASAEPLTALPSETESKERYEKAERRLIERYPTFLAKQSEEERQALSDGLPKWTKAREVGAKTYAESGNKATSSRRYWQYMADST